MTYRNTAIGLLTAVAIAAAPIAPAMARGWDHHGGWGRGGGGGYYHGGGGGGLLFGLGAAVGALVTAPFAIAGAVLAPGPVYATPGYPAPVGYAAAPAPVYAAPAYAYPAPVYGYYGRPHRVVYAYPAPVYGAY